MTSLTDLRAVVDVVIGVDTHVDSHAAAVVDARTGGVIAEITVSADADGYRSLTEFADQHAILRCWAIEGTGGHGAGLARHLARGEELVVELDRPNEHCADTGRSPIPWMRSGRLARHCPGPDSAPHEAEETGKRCPCASQPVAPLCRHVDGFGVP
jgi:hypothetical protein